MSDHIPYLSACVFALVLVSIPQKALGMRTVGSSQKMTQHSGRVLQHLRDVQQDTVDSRGMVGPMKSKLPSSLLEENDTKPYFSDQNILEAAGFIADVSGVLGGSSGNFIAFKSASIPGRVVYMAGSLDTMNGIHGALGIEWSKREKTDCEKRLDKVGFVLSVVSIVTGVVSMGAPLAPVAAASLTAHVPANLGAVASISNKFLGAVEEWICQAEIHAQLMALLEEKLEEQRAAAEAAMIARLEEKRRQETWAMIAELYFKTRYYQELTDDDVIIGTVGDEETDPTEELRQQLKAAYENMDSINRLRISLDMDPIPLNEERRPKDPEVPGMTEEQRRDKMANMSNLRDLVMAG